MIEIEIRWGAYPDPNEDGTDNRPEETFKFETKAEADAFMTGVVSAEGWMGYEVLHDTRTGEDTGSEREEQS